MIRLQPDIAIVGAGLVGSAAAIALHQEGFSVLLIDNLQRKQPKPLIQAWDKRVYAISPKNVAWLEHLGVWSRLDITRIGVMQSMEIHGDSFAPPLLLRAEEVRADCLGFIVEAQALMEAMMEQIASLDIPTLFDSTCTMLDNKANQVSLTVSRESSETTLIDSNLLLAADGGQSWVRQELNINAQQLSYQQVALVANFTVEQSHENIARQWFSHDADGDVAIMAWLPLNDHIISIVWSVSDKFGAKLLSLSDDAFTQYVADAGGRCLGELQLLAKPSSFPLSQQKAESLFQDCVLLVGDAAHKIHPMAGQGVNLGFRDVLDLVKVLANKNQYQRLHDPNLLRKYTRLRKVDMAQMLLLTEGLYRLFSHSHPAIKKVRNWGLWVANQAVIKKILVAQAIAR